MTFNNKICIQHEILERIRLFFILNRIRKNVKSYYKKRNEKENITTYRDKINNKKRYAEKLHIRILKETINILKRQE